MERPNLANGGPAKPTGPTPPSASPIGGPAHFSVFGVPVRVSPSFGAMVLLLALVEPQSSGAHKVGAVAGLATLIFLTVLLHELGHAALARAFGGRPAITLYGLGGITNGIPMALPRNRKAIVVLAGSVVGLAVAALLALVRSGVHASAFRDAFLVQAVFVNVAWALANLAPVLPFDGGHLLAASLGPRRALEATTISVIVGGALTVLGIANNWLWMAMLFGSASTNSFHAARRAWAYRRDQLDGLDASVFRAKDALAKGDVQRALSLADEVVRRARTTPVRNGGYTALAWAHVARREGQLAREALAKVEPRDAIDPFTYAAVEDAAGDPVKARRVLDLARKHGFRNPEMSKLHIDLYARDGSIDAATALAIADVDQLTAIDARAVLAAALEAGENGKAATLAHELFERHGEPRDALDEARARMSLADLEGALTVLERVRGSATVDWSAVQADPIFTRVAEDPRFVSLNSTNA